MANAGGGGASVEDREGYKNRAESRRAVRLTVVGGLVGTLIGALLGLGGVALGAKITADREDARADEDFAREQRIETYGDFVASIDTSMGLMKPFVQEPAMGVVPLRERDSPSSEQVAEVEQSLVAVDTLLGRIRVIGGSPVTERARALQVDLIDASQLLKTIHRCHDDRPDAWMCDEPAGSVIPTEGSSTYTPIDILFWAHRLEFLDAIEWQLQLPE